MSILINPIPSVLVPFEIRGGRHIKRDDLPRFKEPEEVVEFLRRHPEVSSREGIPVRLNWIEHDEDWAIAEYHREVGRRGWP